jgi:hypothetical protein
VFGSSKVNESSDIIRNYSGNFSKNSFEIVASWTDEYNNNEEERFVGIKTPKGDWTVSNSIIKSESNPDHRLSTRIMDCSVSFLYILFSTFLLLFYYLK